MEEGSDEQSEERRKTVGFRVGFDLRNTAKTPLPAGFFSGSGRIRRKGVGETRVSPWRFEKNTVAWFYLNSVYFLLQSFCSSSVGSAGVAQMVRAEDS